MKRRHKNRIVECNICDRKKMREALEDFDGQIFSAKICGKNCTVKQRRDKNALYDMHRRKTIKITPHDIDWAANQRREIYFYGGKS